MNDSKSTCSCPAFLKYPECKHFLDMRVCLKECVVLDEVKNIPLGQKKKKEGSPLQVKESFDGSMICVCMLCTA